MQFRFIFSYLDERTRLTVGTTTDYFSLSFFRFYRQLSSTTTSFWFSIRKDSSDISLLLVRKLKSIIQYQLNQYFTNSTNHQNPLTTTSPTPVAKLHGEDVEQIKGRSQIGSQVDKSILKNREMEKQNHFNSFSNLLKQIDSKNVGITEIKTLKQEHDYLDKLRHQRVKIQELKNKYDSLERDFQEQQKINSQLKEKMSRQITVIEELEENLENEVKKRESLEKALVKQIESDKTRKKSKINEINMENEELKKNLKSKELKIFALEDEWSQKFNEVKHYFINEKKALILECEQKIKQAKVKYNQGEIAQLKNLVSRQNKALKAQNEKYEEMLENSALLNEKIQQLQSEVNDKKCLVKQREETIEDLIEEIDDLKQRYEEKDESNRLKGQLEEVRKRMTEMTKGEIEKIEFIVNEFS